MYEIIYFSHTIIDHDLQIDPVVNSVCVEEQKKKRQAWETKLN